MLNEIMTIIEASKMHNFYHKMHYLLFVVVIYLLMGETMLMPTMSQWIQSMCIESV